MIDLCARGWPAILVCAILLTGCNGDVTLGRQHEQNGEPHLAYEDYLAAGEENPDEGAAEAGLRRTAPAAAEYWRKRADKAAEQLDWALAAKCHLKVLQIAPDATDSIKALRRIQLEHPELVQQAHASADSERLSGELLAMVEPKALDDAPDPSDTPQPPVPDGPDEPSKAVRPARPTEADKPAGPGKAGKPSPPAVPEGPAPVTRPEGAATPPKPVLVTAGAAPTGTAAPQPAAPATRPPAKPARGRHVVRPRPTIPQKPPSAKPRLPRPAPAVTPPKPKPKPKPARPANPYAFKPTVSAGTGKPPTDFITIVRVSRDDDRYPKKRDLAGGLSVKVKDTDDDPLEADMEVYLGRRRTMRNRKLRENAVIRVVDESAVAHEIIILDIYDNDETVTVGLRRVD